MTAFTLISVSSFNKTDRDIFGYKAFVVLSDSMSATDFSAGDLVIVKEVDPTTLQVGDIISYISQNSNNYGETVTHKIRALTTNSNGDKGFITYGTTTNSDDETVVTYPYVLGKYQFSLKGVGTFFNFVKTTQGYIFCILIPFLLLIIMQGAETISLFRRYKKEQQALIDKEKQEVEQERLETKKQLEELLALKKQLGLTDENKDPDKKDQPKQDS